MSQKDKKEKEGEEIERFDTGKFVPYELRPKRLTYQSLGYIVCLQVVIVICMIGFLRLLKGVTFGPDNITELKMYQEIKQDWVQPYLMEINAYRSEANISACKGLYIKDGREMVELKLFNYSWPGISQSCDCTDASNRLKTIYKFNKENT